MIRSSLYRNVLTVKPLYHTVLSEDLTCWSTKVVWHTFIEKDCVNIKVRHALRHSSPPRVIHSHQCFFSQKEAEMSVFWKMTHSLLIFSLLGTSQDEKHQKGPVRSLNVSCLMTHISVNFKLFISYTLVAIGRPLSSLKKDKVTNLCQLCDFCEVNNSYLLLIYSPR